MPRYLFGKRPPRSDSRTLRFQDYLSPALLPPPAACNVLATACTRVGVSDPTRLFPLDGNDTLGDCTIAALAHAGTVYNALVGKKSIMSRTEVVRLYLQLTGGVDSGLDELDVLNYWRKHLVSGAEILAFAAIDPKNHTHVQQAITLFGGVYLGFRVPRDCIKQFDARIPWTPGPLTNDGHAVFAAAYDPGTLTVLTWGNTQAATWDWWDECVDEAYAILPPEAKQPEFAPGFSVAQLLSDLRAVAS